MNSLHPLPVSTELGQSVTSPPSTLVDITNYPTGTTLEDYGLIKIIRSPSQVEIFTEIHNDLYQDFVHTERNISILKITELLLESFDIYGFPQLPTDTEMQREKANKILGKMAAQIYDTYPLLRFCDIQNAFEGHALGNLKVDLTTYKEPLTIKQIHDLYRPYYHRWMRRLSRARKAWKEQHQQDKSVPAPTRALPVVIRPSSVIRRVTALRDKLTAPKTDESIPVEIPKELRQPIVTGETLDKAKVARLTLRLFKTHIT